MTRKETVELAKKLYPPEPGWSEPDEPGFHSDYQPIIDSLGDVVIQDDDSGYSGDTWVLYKDPDSDIYGYLCFGWGSCSGCDVLQACSSWDDIAGLIEDLRQEIRWDTREGTIQFFREHDWVGDFNYSRKFLDKVMEYFEELPITINDNNDW